METADVSTESSEKDVEVNMRAISFSVESTTQLVQSDVDSSATELKVKHRVYATVDTVFSGTKSPLTLQSADQIRSNINKKSNFSSCAGRNFKVCRKFFGIPLIPTRAGTIFPAHIGNIMGVL